MNKKAQFDLAKKQIYFMIIGFVMTLILIGTFMMMSKYKANLMEYPPELESSLINMGFVNNPGCFAYQDESSGRVFHNTIDIKKFTNERMNNFCYPLEKQEGYIQYNFKMVLENSAKEVVTNNYYNKNDLTLFLPVLVYDNKMIKEDQLILYVQTEI